MRSVNINEWAIKWRVPFAAVEDLRREFGAVNTDPVNEGDEGSEARAQTLVRLEATAKGCRLWRNNVGAVYTDESRFLRYGLANDSKRMNDLIKSSDLIGIKPTVITTRMVGFTMGQFMAREIKKPGWKYTATKAEVAQLKFLELVVSLGGDAAFVTGEGSI